jgi:hypothetical protein
VQPALAELRYISLAESSRRECYDGDGRGRGQRQDPGGHGRAWLRACDAGVYKGDGWLDLRAAELSGPVTTFLAVAYKSTVTILVPRSVRVEMTGFGVTQGLADEEDPGYHLPADAPVIHVRGVAYKGAVEITTRPPERRALGA